MKSFGTEKFWKAYRPGRAPHLTVPAAITDKKMLVTFTSNVENPQINGIEIIPQP